MSYDDLAGLRISVADGVATVTLDHPPLNLMDGVLLPSLRGFVDRVRHDTDVRVVVFDSADPEFFSAHGDMAYLTDPDALPAATAAAIAAAPDAPIPDGMNILEAMSDEVRTLPQITIGKIAGFARGAGNEFLMYLDLRFAAIGRSGQAQPEAAMQILPGGAGTVNMARLLGRPRALEILLGGELVGAELAERYGLVNRALPADELDAFVDRLARRIARLRPEVIAAVKNTVETITPKIPHHAYAVENAALFSLFTEDMVESAHRQLAAGVQTREGERDLERILDSL
ncbi:putative enoyl-CoA hydratase [Actinoplanes sp. NBRC 14428]|uniref:Enoyl-CoA hydratase/carnithine racemase n=1 Tax=Pseudosporangium ferrugineum TaxID=439699 RepID=A0A2T0SBG0_9ACTN|nr:enoyl-CoA hydratase/isomerase family protein [Pseudosporangium ferrugineum]PRY30760.1 enoyl-CoA hydratase/carnithine racemase [Pseudosporangium ferrugineum]BCJ50314.1 putative enoyl-CoA hydratase [Actinoplanes sp. NBRC 14428]